MRRLIKLTERQAARKALELERRAAKVMKKQFHDNQSKYLRRKLVKKKLVKGEKEAYKASIRAFEDLCTELRATRDRLRHARLEYEKTLTAAQKAALAYSQGWRDREYAYTQEQAALTQAVPQQPEKSKEERVYEY